MASTAVLFASGMTGNTKRVAGYIAGKTGADIFDLKSSNPDISGYDTVFIGTGVHAGKPYKQALSYVQANSDVLSSKKCSLFLLCMYNGERGDRQLSRISDEFGIADAVYFNNKDSPTKDGVPPAVDGYIERVMQ